MLSETKLHAAGATKYSTRPTRVAFLVNGSPHCAMAIRAGSFAKRLPEYGIEIFYRHDNKLAAIAIFWYSLLRCRAEVVYLFDMGFSSVAAATLFVICNWSCRIIIDTGDAIGFLAESTGTRSWLSCKLTAFLEAASIRLADILVVRSHFHQSYLRRRKKRLRAIPDGVDVDQFGPQKSSTLRNELGLRDQVVIGVLGSITWIPRFDVCYGWDLVRALAELRDLPVIGLVVGSGDGLGRLKEMAARLGVSDRIVFVGWQPYERLPSYINLMDICLSTQTNDLAGNVRTTGKLPLYLACGKHVISTSVGEAARVLPNSMLLEYNGTKDDDYPRRLALRLRELIASGEWRHSVTESRRLARLFDYTVLAESVRAVISECEAR